MTRKDTRLDQADLYPNDTDPAVATVIARASERSESVRSDEERIHIFWRVFGGALLSICALVGITLYNHMQSNFTELRTEVARMNEARGDLVKKDEFNSRITANYERITAVHTQTTAQVASVTGLKSELDGLKERLAKQAADHDAARKDAGAAMDAMKKEIAALDTIKEKLTAINADLKLIHEDSLRAKAELERNTLADTERKGHRDEQSKVIEKSLKDLQAALLDCQVKLARLEGLQQAAPTKPKEKESP